MMLLGASGLTAGLAMSWPGQHTFSIFVPYNFIKNRIQSAADIASQDLQNAQITDETKKVHVQGDAAFADYSVSIGYAFRFGAKNKVH
jgi:hypothetical protein